MQWTIICALALELLHVAMLFNFEVACSGISTAAGPCAVSTPQQSMVDQLDNIHNYDPMTSIVCV